VKSLFTITPVRGATVLLALSLAGCSTFDNLMSSDKVDYRSQAAKTQPLEVPPDLTQLARDGRYQPQGGVVSATAMKKGGAAATPDTTANPSLVAPTSLGDSRIERQGNVRWMTSTLPPEKLYPLVRGFWLERGFLMAVDSPEVGVMETDWAENRAKLPQDIIRRTIGSVLSSFYSTSERDRFRTRIERTATGSEIYISHKGLSEVYTSDRKDGTSWQPRPTDPELEAEFLSRLMVRLGTKDEVARSAVAAATVTPAQAKPVVAAATSTMEINQPFDRAWRQVGLGLDRSGFTVEDRDRTAGLYFVRYIDPKTAGKDEPNFIMKLFTSDKDARPTRYRVLVKANGNKTTVSIQNNLGAADDSETARIIIGKLTEEIR
jgi:outer membrane protein assembly factor BamC